MFRSKCGDEMARSKKLKVPGMPVRSSAASIPMVKGEEEHEKPIDDNPEIKTYKKVDGALVIEKTHSKPVVHSESHKIEEMQAQIAKIDGVIAIWQSKKVKFQAIIDKYNEIL